MADFSQALATLHDRFGHELQVLVETFRKRNGELRKERSMFVLSLIQGIFLGFFPNSFADCKTNPQNNPLKPKQFAVSEQSDS